jgi:hypothetical protein
MKIGIVGTGPKTDDDLVDREDNAGVGALIALFCHIDLEKNPPIEKVLLDKNDMTRVSW